MMASAALGNLCSDVLGLGMGDAVEAGAKKMGVPAAKLTAEQVRNGSLLYTKLF